MPAHITTEHRDTILEAHGYEGTLRGESARVILERSVAVVGEGGEIVEKRTRASVASTLNPARGDVIEADGETFRVSDIDSDDGVFARAWVR